MSLKANDLKQEILYAGETIAYYSMMFVSGDKRGYRIAKIICIDPTNVDYPLRLDTQELIPMTLMIRRKMDRYGVLIPSKDTKWRKLRTFTLQRSEVTGIKTNADILHETIQSSIQVALNIQRKQDLSGAIQKPIDHGNEDDKSDKKNIINTKKPSITSANTRKNKSQSTLTQHMKYQSSRFRLNTSSTYLKQNRETSVKESNVHLCKSVQKRRNPSDSPKIRTFELKTSCLKHNLGNFSVQKNCKRPKTSHVSLTNDENNNLIDKICDDFEDPVDTECKIDADSISCKDQTPQEINSRQLLLKNAKPHKLSTRLNHTTNVPRKLRQQQLNFTIK